MTLISMTMARGHTLTIEPFSSMAFTKPTVKRVTNLVLIISSLLLSAIDQSKRICIQRSSTFMQYSKSTS